MATLQDLLTQAQGKTATIATTVKKSPLQVLLEKAGTSTTPDSSDRFTTTEDVRRGATAANVQSTQDNSISGIIKNTIKGLPEASGIPQAFKNSFQSGVEAVDTMQKPSNTPIQTGLQSGVQLGNAVGGVFFSELAPVSNLFSKLINAAGENYSKVVPGGEKTVENVANGPFGDTADKILKTFEGFGGLAMNILGAKGGDIRTAEPPTEAPAVPVKPPVVTAEAPHTPIPVETIKPTSVPPKTGGVVSNVAKDIQTKAIETGLTDSFKDLATYERRTIKEQAQKISDLITADPTELGRIVRGEKPVPDGISPTYLVTAVDKYARQTQDPHLLQDLVSSRLTGDVSTHGSELRMAAERDQSSAMQALKDLQSTREAAQATRGRSVKSEVASAKSFIQRAHTPKTWEEFVGSIEC